MYLHTSAEITLLSRVLIRIASSVVENTLVGSELKPDRSHFLVGHMVHNHRVPTFIGWLNYYRVVFFQVHQCPCLCIRQVHKIIFFDGVLDSQFHC